MVMDSKRVLRRLIESKQDAIKQKVIVWDREHLRTRKPLEPKDKVYLIFGRITRNTLPTSLYVGKTRQSLDSRFAQHMYEVSAMLNGSKNWTIKYRWMYEMIEKGQFIRILMLNKVQRSKIYQVENEWIYYLGLHNFNMMNKSNHQYYSKKVYKR